MYNSLLARDLDSRRAGPFLFVRFDTHFILHSPALPCRVGQGDKVYIFLNQDTNLAC